MFYVLELWYASFIFEWLLFLVPPFWRIRRVYAMTLILWILIATGWLWPKFGLFLGAPFIFLAVFRCLNLLRVVKNRMHEQYLRTATERTSRRISLLYPIVVIILVTPYVLNIGSYLNLLIATQLLVAAVIFIITIHNIVKLKFSSITEFLVDRELPTVTVAIPARDETKDLQDCLHAILANDYPKLEIIVLDDCSQNKTAEIIKSFAHDGVRFVPGDPPAERWLAKNQAYEKLYKEASGDLLLFCGVDTRLGPQAIRSMVNLMYARKKAMVSVLPVRSQSSPADAFIQPMRYWWELALPRKLFNRPPVLSTCWLISREAIKQLGGFASVSHAILPEGFFARELVKTNRYSFVRSSNELEVKTAKTFNEQLKTAIRTRYPQIRRRPEWALVITVIDSMFLLLPFVLLVMSFWIPGINTLITGATCLLLVLTHVCIVNVTDPSNSLLALVSFPVAVLSEVMIGYSSMIKYEFMTVDWKDRNICIPVMHFIPRLPKLPVED